jgi:[ribosomal protein S5]-alanine N-acetyltransferase
MAPVPGRLVGRTARLVLRHFTLDDAAFILELVNEPDWLRFIGDRDVHTLEQARTYLERGPMSLYDKFGFGFYRVELAADGTPVGMCGLIQREVLDGVDIGFALLERHERCGYGHEAAAEVVRQAREDHGLDRLLAITNLDNARSIALLEKLGMHYERDLRLPGEDADVRLYAMELGAGG